MAGQSNAAPVIIKRKKVITGGGHHGGAWKVAYADFVTAMMAFFMLMWLLNATTEKQRKGLADFFSADIPITSTSGGGSGALGGDSAMAEAELVFQGIGATDRHPTEERAARGATGPETGADSEVEALRRVIEAALARAAEQGRLSGALAHVVVRVTDEGLSIELFDLPSAPLFQAETDRPTLVLRQLADLLAEVLPLTTNRLAIGGHLRSHPITLIDNPAWSLSADRAQALRALLDERGLPAQRIQRVTGHADRRPVVRVAQAVRNNRVEVVLLLGHR